MAVFCKRPLFFSPVSASLLLGPRRHRAWRRTPAPAGTGTDPAPPPASRLVAPRRVQTRHCRPRPACDHRPAAARRLAHRRRKPRRRVGRRQEREIRRGPGRSISGTPRCRNVSIESAGDRGPCHRASIPASTRWLLQTSRPCRRNSAASGDLHVRNEHGNVHNRINGIQLPDGRRRFSARFSTPGSSGRLSLITGALPAQYGPAHTSGVVDIPDQKQDAFQTTGGSVSLYGGSHQTITPYFRIRRYGPDRPQYFVTEAVFAETIWGSKNPTARE